VLSIIFLVLLIGMFIWLIRQSYFVSNGPTFLETARDGKV